MPFVNPVCQSSSLDILIDPIWTTRIRRTHRRLPSLMSRARYRITNCFPVAFLGSVVHTLSLPVCHSLPLLPSLSHGDKAAPTTVSVIHHLLLLHRPWSSHQILGHFGTVSFHVHSRSKILPLFFLDFQRRLPKLDRRHLQWQP